jgi:eukaryotic-like serine/threonine-protein kinase
MDDDVAKLVREQRLVEAAELAATKGDPRTASSLFERACQFERAAREAIHAKDWGRALPLALEGKSDAVAEEAFPHLVKDEHGAERVAYRLEQRGDFGWSGRVLEAIGKRHAAAKAYERAGDAIRASALLEAEGDVVGASRVLEAQVRREPGRSPLLVALGALLLRYGKTDAAVRSLQKVKGGDPERRAALSLLVPAFDRMGLAQARVEADQELTALGGPIAIDAPVPKALEVRARLFGRYEVVREVASSPHARVVECFDAVRSERVAVKIFAGYHTRGGGRDALARFEREVRVLGTLDHQNIVPLREYVPEGPALVLAWMSHGTLEQMVKNEPLAPARAVEIALAILSALGEAHRLGVIHRDIKPANVLFDDAGVTRLGDFGVAHLSDLSATATAGVIGTLGYMSPEQREGRPATVKSDLYGVGAILWEMLTGEKPEAGLGASTLQVRPSGVHRDLSAKHDSLVLSFMSQDPKDRPEDSFAARRALGAIKWPNTIEKVAAPRAEVRRESDRPSGVRLLPSTDDHGIEVDQWLGRKVVCLPLDDATLARASVFARADHHALQAVLRVDRAGGNVWLAAPRGTHLAGKLTPAQSATLRDALAALHEIGHPHGAVDPEHVFVDETGAVVLAYAPPPGPTTTFDVDRLALAALSGI